MSYSPSSAVFYALRDEAATFNSGLSELDLFVRSLGEEPEDLGQMLVQLVVRGLEERFTGSSQLADVLEAVALRHPEIADAAAFDLEAVCERDPAAQGVLRPFLFFKGFLSIQAQRFAHALWGEKAFDAALFLQSRTSIVLSVDIHPAARLGKGLLMDHATGVVIGETAIVGDDVSILHGVTLGGTGKERGDRHPKVHRGVLIGAGATVLGNISIGEYSCLAAGSVVLEDVPPHVTVAGTPAKIVGTSRHPIPSAEMDQRLPAACPFITQKKALHG